MGQRGHITPQSVADLTEHGERQIPLAALDASDIGPIQLRHIREHLLCQTPLLPKKPDPVAKRFEMIFWHAGVVTDEDYASTDYPAHFTVWIAEGLAAWPNWRRYSERQQRSDQPSSSGSEAPEIPKSLLGSSADLRSQDGTLFLQGRSGKTNKPDSFCH